MFRFQIDEKSELRLIEERHAEELNALVLDNFEHIREWSGWLRDRNRTVEMTRDWIRQNMHRFANGLGFEMAIWHRGKMAGQIGYNYFDTENRRTEIGYWLGKKYQGKGLVTRSCAGLINHAFKNLNINRVEIRCGTGNTKSRRIPESLGFTKEGIAREAEWLHDRFIDLAVYSMLSSDWKKRMYNKR
jgi:ribosomal-protein-serine acetyltransferase